MKSLKRCISVLMVMIFLMIGTAYAATDVSWEDFWDGRRESTLLQNGETESEDESNKYSRGVIFSAGILKITNNQDGTLHISVETYAHEVVDKIYQTVFLDVWDEEKEDWVKVDKWDFQRTKEEEADLSAYHVGFTVTGCELNRYYRARAMHLVQLGNDYEGKSTETDGVLLTDHEV